MSNKETLARRELLRNTYANLRGLAQNFYKSKKNGAEIVLREMISNAIHACFIKKEESKSKNSNYIPEVFISIQGEYKQFIIKDNGCGFCNQDKEVFADLAESNQLKKKYYLPSKGLGRLALVHFPTNATFKTINDGLDPRGLSFDYPEKGDQLPFFCERKEETKEESGTEVTIVFPDNIYMTFANKYKEVQKIKIWILENFAYLLYGLNDLKLQIELNKEQELVVLENAQMDSFDTDIGDKSYHLMYVWQIAIKPP